MKITDGKRIVLIGCRSADLMARAELLARVHETHHVIIVEGEQILLPREEATIREKCERLIERESLVISNFNCLNYKSGKESRRDRRKQERKKKR